MTLVIMVKYTNVKNFLPWQLKETSGMFLLVSDVVCMRHLTIYMLISSAVFDIEL